jgi:hypothetical protein
LLPPQIRSALSGPLPAGLLVITGVNSAVGLRLSKPTAEVAAGGNA